MYMMVTGIYTTVTDVHDRYPTEIYCLCKQTLQSDYILKLTVHSHLHHFCQSPYKVTSQLRGRPKVLNKFRHAKVRAIIKNLIRNQLQLTLFGGMMKSHILKIAVCRQFVNINITYFMTRWFYGKKWKYIFRMIKPQQQ